MLRTGIGCLYKLAFSEFWGQCLGSHLQCRLLHSSVLLSKKASASGSHGSSSSDSDSDPAELGDGAEVDEKLKEAAEKVAQSVPHQGSAMQSDLLKQLQSFAKLSKDQATGGPSSQAVASRLSDLLSGMQVQKSNQRRNQGDKDFMRAGPRSGRLPVRRQQSQADREKVKLFDGPGLGIFTSGDASPVTKDKEAAPEARLSLWEQVEQEQLQMFERRPPTNAFEEMIQWTQEGKLWQFPINNEQGLDEEAKIGFHQHVFLQDQIQDFPRRGPIRHFMELVLIGLSKNPHLTVQQKHEHIDWFRQYFREKEDVLREALGQDGLIATAESS